MPEDTSPAMVRIGLTGGIASGKSTVGRLLEGHGCFVTDADTLVSELYAPGEAGAQIVAEIFGSELLLDSGAVDKAALAERVFTDSEARKKLEQSIHPLVGQRFAQQAAEVGGIVVFEATLLVDTGGYRGFDALITVEADEELRIARAVTRGMTERDARARLAAQCSSDDRRAVADWVIDNSGTEDELRRKVASLYASLVDFLQQSRALREDE